MVPWPDLHLGMHNCRLVFFFTVFSRGSGSSSLSFSMSSGEPSYVSDDRNFTVLCYQVKPVTKPIVDSPMFFCFRVLICLFLVFVCFFLHLLFIFNIYLNFQIHLRVRVVFKVSTLFKILTCLKSVLLIYHACASCWCLK